MEDSKKVLAVRVNFAEKSYSHGQQLNIRAYFWELNETLTEADHIRYYGKFADLQHVELQADAYTDGELRGLGGVSIHGVRFSNADSDVEELERGLKGMKKVKKGMDRLHEEEGSPESFGAYVVRFAKAAGAKYIIVETEERAPFGFATDPAAWRSMPLGTGKDFINARTREYLKKHGLEPVS